MSVETKDILFKAAEDVQQGMWCKGSWFHLDGMHWANPFTLIEGGDNVERATASERCAEGSIALATRLLGGTNADFEKARYKVETQISCEGHAGRATLAEHNDYCLGDDPFEAGQQLAELFRATAEAL
jgi:hypothetical protein